MPDGRCTPYTQRCTMTNRLQPAYQAGIKGDKGTSTKALKQLTEKDYKLHRGSATEVFSRAVIPAQPKTLTANIDSQQTISSLANIDCHPSGILHALSKDGWSQPVGGCAPKGVTQ